jgi:hypothetical protein
LYFDLWNNCFLTSNNFVGFCDGKTLIRIKSCFGVMVKNDFNKIPKILECTSRTTISAVWLFLIFYFEFYFKLWWLISFCWIPNCNLSNLINVSITWGVTVMWIHKLLEELMIPTSWSAQLWCDNIGATYLTSSPVLHAWMKHIDVDYHFVRERVAQKLLEVRPISTNDQVADGFTKPLTTRLLEQFKGNLSMADSCDWWEMLD